MISISTTSANTRKIIQNLKCICYLYHLLKWKKHNSCWLIKIINYLILSFLTVMGALSHGLLVNVRVLSNLLITMGGIIIPGTAIKILEGITCLIASIAATELNPISSPFSVSTIMPFTISCWRYKNVTEKQIIHREMRLRSFNVFNLR